MPSRTRNSWIVAAGLAITGWLCPAVAMAQTNERLYENLNFRFETPGARPLGMGKTFVGLADDATAALSNPAGLSNLLEQEFSLEFRGTRDKTTRSTTGLPGDTQNFGEFVFTPSFISYVLPFNRLTVSLFRNSVQNFREDFQFGPRQVPGREFPEDGAFGSISVQSDKFGAGGAFVVSPSLSVGGSVNLVTMNMASQSRSGTPLNQRNGTNTIDSGDKWSGSVGVLWKPRRGTSIGGTYIHKATFPMMTRLFGTFLWTQFDPEGTLILTGDQRPIDYVIPARYAVGGSWRVRDSLTVAVDVARVLYSQRITENFLVVDFIDPGAQLSPDNFYFRDVTELHVGGEYRFYLERSTLAVRAGMFTDPNHPLRYRAGGNNPDHPAALLLPFRFNTVPDQTDIGGTAGIGFALFNRVQIDTAVSFSPRATEIVSSVVFRLR